VGDRVTRVSQRLRGNGWSISVWTPLRRLDNLRGSFIGRALKKMSSDFKNWKTVILRRAMDHVNAWVKANPRAKHATTFKSLREIVNHDFERHWLSLVFPLFAPAVDLCDVSRLGILFLHCKFSYSVQVWRRLIQTDACLWPFTALTDPLSSQIPSIALYGPRRS
jgi:hypothetical protein